MKRILYASGGFLTHDLVADAIMDYANVLALVDSADVVRCIGVDDDGEVRGMQLLIGPASQILAMETAEPAVDMDVEKTVAELRRRAQDRLPTSFDVADPESAVPSGEEQSAP